MKHKNGRKPTRAQKILIKSSKLDPENWLVMKETPTALEILNKATGSVRHLNKEIDKKISQKPKRLVG